jgi:hypothetical protein
MPLVVECGRQPASPAEMLITEAPSTARNIVVVPDFADIP